MKAIDQDLLLLKNEDDTRALGLRIAEALDCDRELVETAFTKAAGKVNHPEMAETDEDFTGVFDAFCENLLEVALREDPKDRHPNRLHLEEISNISLTGIPNLAN